MDGIAYPEPFDREVSVVSEVFVSEERLFQVAKFENKRPVAEAFGEIAQHLVEDGFPFRAFRIGQKIFTAAVGVCLVGESRNIRIMPCDAKQLSLRGITFASHDKQGLVTGSLFQYPEQSRGVEHVVSRQRRNVFRTFVCGKSEHHSIANIDYFFDR